MSLGEENAKRKNWQFSLRSLLLSLVFVGLASGWLVTVVKNHEEKSLLQSQIDGERTRAARMYEYVYMTGNEETKSQLRDAWQKAQQ